MTIAFGSLGNGPAGTGSSATATMPSGIVAGNLLVLLVLTKASSPPTVDTPTGWTAPANNTWTGGAGTQDVDSGNVRVTLFYKVAEGSDTASLTFSASSSPFQCATVRYTKTEASWDPVVCTGASDTTGSTTSYDPPAAADTLALSGTDWLGVGSALNGDAGTPGTAALSVAGVTLGTLNARATGGSGLGDDSRFGVHDAAYSSGTAAGAPDFSWAFTGAAANFAGASVFFRLREATGATEIAVDPATFSLTGLDPAPSGSGTAPLAADIATVALVGVDPALAGSGETAIPLDPAALTLAGVDPTLAGSGVAAVTVDPAVLVLVGQDPSVDAGGIEIAVDPAVLVLDGADHALAATGTAPLPTDPATLALTGVDPALTAAGSTSVAVDPAVLVLLGVDPSFSGPGAPQVAGRLRFVTRARQRVAARSKAHEAADMEEVTT